MENDEFARITIVVWNIWSEGAQHWFRPFSMMPLDIVCPHCKAAVGYRCSNGRGFNASTHLSRWKAIGITNPSDDDLKANYLDGERRIRNRIEERYTNIK